MAYTDINTALPADTEAVSAGASRIREYKTQVADFMTKVLNGSLAVGLATAHGALFNSVLTISDWNMDANASKVVTTVIATGKVRAISATILSDDGLTSTQFEYGGDSISVTGTSITLTRTAGGVFDSTSYDAATGVRGYVTVWYVA